MSEGAGRRSAVAGMNVRGAVDRLAIVFGDQLDRGASALEGLDPDRDAVLMMEVDEEATHVPSHKQRTALFLAAMRHFALDVRERGLRVRYVRLDDPHNTHSFEGEIERSVRMLRPSSVVFTRPGEWRVLRMTERALEAASVAFEMLEDGHFLTTPREFAAWAEGRRELVMEYFYREQRRRLGVLVDERGRPEAGAWNFDKDNRESFRSTPNPPRPYTPRPDAVTKEVLSLVERRFGDAPGTLEGFRWPVTPAEARRALDDFIEHRLPRFGRYEDAMWTGQPFLYHSLLSSSLNLKFIDPRTCVDAAVEAYRRGHAPINAVEGFVRQLIGWREFIRGVYWLEGEAYADRNGLEQRGALPDLYWTGESDMACVRDCVRGVIEHGFGHHIPRLMVLGNLALVAGVHPRAVSDWFLGMYVDAVDWVTLPNTLGMSQHADGGVVGTKPYAASGKYIARMSNYCEHCRFDVGRRTGENACPFNTLYWDFLIRHRERLRGNPRMAMVLRNVDRLDEPARVEITREGGRIRRQLGVIGRA